MSLSPKQQTEAWVDTATTGQLVNLIDHLIEHSLEAAVLAYQFVRADTDPPEQDQAGHATPAGAYLDAIAAGMSRAQARQFAASQGE